MQLHWAESQAIHVWRAAGYTPTQIASGMRLNINTVTHETYYGFKTKRALEAMPLWCDVDLHTGHRRAKRMLTPYEADAVVLWLALGYEAEVIAKVMQMTRDHVMTYLCRKTKASVRMKQKQVETV